jgi:hypothetical protein
MSSIGSKTSLHDFSSGSNQTPQEPAPNLSSASQAPQGEPSENFSQQQDDVNRDKYVGEIAADLAKNSQGHEGDLSASTRVTRQAVNPQSIDVAPLGPFATLSTQSVGAGNGNGSLTADRTGVLGHGQLTAGGTTLSTAAGVVAGNTYGEVTVKTGAHDSITAGLLNGAGIHGTGVTLSQFSATGAINEGLFVVGNANLSVKVLDLDGDKAQLQFIDAKLAGLQATLGGSMGVVGGGLRLFGSYAKEYSLKRWLPLAEASKAVGKQNLLKQKLRSVGLLKAPFVRPDLTDPLNESSSSQQAPNRLLVTDEVSFTRQGTLTGGIAGAFGGIYVGAHGSWSAEFRTTVVKLDDAKVRVIVSPTSNKTITGGLSIDVPLLASATVAVTRSTARYAAYDFDLTEPRAKQAYQDALKLKVPSAILQIGPSMLADPQQTMKTLSDASELIPGVQVVSLMYGSLPAELSLSGGLTGLKNIFGDAVGMMGYKLRAGKSTVLWASPSSVLKRNEASHETRQASFWPGEKKISSRLVDETLEVGQNDAATSVRQLSLEADILFERPSAKTRKEIISWLNDNFLMMPISATRRAVPLSDKYGYGVKVSRQLSDEDLEKLWRLGALKGRAYSADIFGGGAPEGALFEGEIKEAFISGLKNGIVSGGPKEMARLHQFLGKRDGELKIKVIYEALEKIDAKANAAKVKYYKVMSENDPKSSIVKRLDTTQKLIDKLENVSTLIESDPLLSRYVTRTIEDKKNDIKKAVQEVLPIAGMTTLKAHAMAGISAKLKKKDREKFNEVFEKLDKLSQTKVP